MIVIRDHNNDTRSVTTKLIAGQPGCQLMKKSTTENRTDTGRYWVGRLQRHRFFRHAHYTHITATRQKFATIFCCKPLPMTPTNIGPFY